MNKETLKERLIAMQERLIAEMQEKIATTHSMVDVDEDDTRDPEDFSHQYESGEMEQLMKVQLNKAQGNLQKLKTIDFSSKSSVCPGAFVETNQMCFFIGFATIPFDWEGKHVVGISPESPIYPIMLDKKTGQEFSFSGRNYRIDNIN